MARAVRPPRHPVNRRPERLPRPAFAATRAAACVRAPAGEPTSASGRPSGCAAGADRRAAEVGCRGPAEAPSNAGAEVEDTAPHATADEAANAASEPSRRCPAGGHSSARGGSAPRRSPEGVGSPSALARPCHGVHGRCYRASARASCDAGGAEDSRGPRAAGPEDDPAGRPSAHRRVASWRGPCGSACSFFPRLQAAVPPHGGAEACPYH